MGYKYLLFCSSEWCTPDYNTPFELFRGAFDDIAEAKSAFKPGLSASGHRIGWAQILGFDGCKLEICLEWRGGFWDSEEEWGPD